MRYKLPRHHQSNTDETAFISMMNQQAYDFISEGLGLVELDTLLLNSDPSLLKVFTARPGYIAMLESTLATMEQMPTKHITRHLVYAHQEYVRRLRRHILRIKAGDTEDAMYEQG